MNTPLPLATVPVISISEQRQLYVPPAIVYELILETGAGSPLPNPPEEIVDPFFGLPPTPPGP